MSWDQYYVDFEEEIPPEDRIYLPGDDQAHARQAILDALYQRKLPPKPIAVASSSSETKKETLFFMRNKTSEHTQIDDLSPVIELRELLNDAVHRTFFLPDFSRIVAVHGAVFREHRENIRDRKMQIVFLIDHDMFLRVEASGQWTESSFALPADYKKPPPLGGKTSGTRIETIGLYEIDPTKEKTDHERLVDLEMQERNFFNMRILDRKVGVFIPPVHVYIEKYQFIVEDIIRPFTSV